MDPDTLEIHVDGRGERADGIGSGYAWKDVKTGRHEIQWEDRLTNNQAEYKGLLLAVNSLADGTTAVLQTDSQILCEQFNGRYQVNDLRLAKVLVDFDTKVEQRRDRALRSRFECALRPKGMCPTLTVANPFSGWEIGNNNNNQKLQAGKRQARKSSPSQIRFGSCSGGRIF